MTYRDLEESGIALAVSDASLRFHAPARYDDVVHVTTTLAEVRSRTVTFEYLITRVHDAARLVSAVTRLVSIDRAGRTIALPADFRDLLARAQTED